MLKVIIHDSDGTIIALISADVTSSIAQNARLKKPKKQS